MPQYAVLPRATHVDRRRRVSGAAVVEEGFLRLPGQEQQSAVPQRWCGSDTSGSTPGQLRDSAMKAGGDWTGTRPSCNLRADRRCLLCVLRASVGGCSLGATGGAAAKPKPKRKARAQGSQRRRGSAGRRGDEVTPRHVIDADARPLDVREPWVGRLVVDGGGM
jgi:hypothetical protein